MEWDLSLQERLDLRTMLSGPGWKLWNRKLKELEEDCRELVEVADEESRWREAKGYLAAVRQVRDLAGNLITVAEEGREAWLKKKLEQAEEEMAEARALLLGKRERARAQ